jgi:hypothetical protein
MIRTLLKKYREHRARQVQKLVEKIESPRGKERRSHSWRDISYSLRYPNGLDLSRPAFGYTLNAGQVGLIEVHVDGIKVPGNIGCKVHEANVLTRWFDFRGSEIPNETELEDRIGRVCLESDSFSPLASHFLPKSSEHRREPYHPVATAESITNGNRIARIIIDDWKIIGEEFGNYYRQLNENSTYEEGMTAVYKLKQRLNLKLKSLGHEPYI